MPANRVLDEALRLPESERAALAAALIESLDLDTDDDASAAWDAELRRRLDELDRGDVTPIPWDEARRRIAGQTDDSAG